MTFRKPLTFGEMMALPIEEQRAHMRALMDSITVDGVADLTLLDDPGRPQREHQRDVDEYRIEQELGGGSEVEHD